MITDMDSKEIKVRDIILIATKSAYIKRAEVLDISGWWLDVITIEDKKS